MRAIVDRPFLISRYPWLLRHSTHILRLSSDWEVCTCKTIKITPDIGVFDLVSLSLAETRCIAAPLHFMSPLTAS